MNTFIYLFEYYTATVAGLKKQTHKLELKLIENNQIMIRSLKYVKATVNIRLIFQAVLDKK